MISNEIRDWTVTSIKTFGFINGRRIYVEPLGFRIHGADWPPGDNWGQNFDGYFLPGEVPSAKNI